MSKLRRSEADKALLALCAALAAGVVQAEAVRGRVLADELTRSQRP